MPQQQPIDFSQYGTPVDDPVQQTVQDYIDYSQFGASVERDWSVVPNYRTDLPPLERNTVPVYRHTGPGEAGARAAMALLGREDTIDRPESDESFNLRNIQHLGFFIPENSRPYDSLRAAVDYTPGDRASLARIVDERFNGEARLEFSPEYGDHVIVFDDGRVAPFYNPHPMSAQNAYDFLPEIERTLGVMAGGVLGSIGGLHGSVLGAGIGDSLVRYDTLKQGKAMGWHDTDEQTMILISLWEAGVGMAIDISTLGAFRFARLMLGNNAVRFAYPTMTDDFVDAAVEYEKRLQIDLTSGQAAAGVRREAGSKADDAAVRLSLDPENPALLAQRDTARAAQQQAERQAEVLGQIERAFELSVDEMPDALIRYDAMRRNAEAVIRAQAAESMEGGAVVGREIIESAGRDVQAATNEIVQSVAARSTEARTQLSEWFQSADIGDLGTEFRNSAMTARNNAFNDASVEYQAIKASVPADTTIDMAALQQTAVRLKDVLDADLLQSQIGDDVRILQDIIDSGSITLDQTSRAISTLRAELRVINRTPGASRAKDAPVLVSLIHDLTEARKTALRDVNPDIADALIAQDAVYAGLKEQFDESLINRVIRKRNNGGWMVPDWKILDGFLKNPSELRNLMAISSDPRFGGFDAVPTLREAVLDAYERDVIIGGGSHDAFMRQYRRGINELFPDQSKFENAQVLGNFIRTEKQRETALMKELRRTTNYELRGYDPATVLRQANSPEKIEAVRHALRDSPERWEEFKGLWKNQMIESTSTLDEFGEMAMNFPNLRKYINNNPDVVRAVYGNQYLTNLRQYLDILRVDMRPKGPLTGPRAEMFQENPPTGWIMNTWRATIARPLSRRGLLTTAGVKIHRGTARQALYDSLDPKTLQKIVSLNNLLYPKSQVRKTAYDLFVILGLTDMAEEIMDDDELMPAEDIPTLESLPSFFGGEQ